MTIREIFEEKYKELSAYASHSRGESKGRRDRKQNVTSGPVYQRTVTGFCIPRRSGAEG